MAVFYNVVALFGGLAMFLYGMRVMGDSLKASQGSAMKDALAKVTNRPVLAFLLGVVVTCVIQSSTATIVLTVGLVGAGFLTFRQSIGVVLGANVGTAITAQVIRLMDVSSSQDSILYFFKADNLAPLALVIGIALIMFTKKNSSKNIGNVCAGFGVLFMGLIFMSDAVSVFRDSLSGLLTAFQNNYLLQFGSGLVVTGVIQSSSAVVGILQSVASSVGVTFSGIFAVLIGVNIGDCLTTFLVSRIGARPAQIRTALVHVIYNVCAATFIIVILLILRSTGVISDELWLRTLNSGGVANLHGIFRLTPAICLLPFSGAFAKIAEKLVPDKEKPDEDQEILSDIDNLVARRSASSVMDLAQTQHLIEHMSAIAYHNFDGATRQIFSFDPTRDARIEEREELLDKVADEVNKYIVSLAPHINLEKDNITQNFQLKALICFERIGDLACNINKSVIAMRESHAKFSDNAMAELKIALSAVDEILSITVNAFRGVDYDKAKQIEPLEEVIDELIENLNNRHIYRMSNKLCDGIVGIHFQNILTNIEHVSDKCSDLAIYIMEQKDNSIFGKEHEFIHMLHHSNDAAYQALFNVKYDYYFSILNTVPVQGEFNTKIDV